MSAFADALRCVADDFAGREWLVRKLDDFIEHELSGYFVIQVAAGELVSGRDQ